MSRSANNAYYMCPEFCTGVFVIYNIYLHEQLHVGHVYGTLLIVHLFGDLLIRLADLETKGSPSAGRDTWWITSYHKSTSSSTCLLNSKSKTIMSRILKLDSKPTQQHQGPYIVGSNEAVDGTALHLQG